MVPNPKLITCPHCRKRKRDAKNGYCEDCLELVVGGAVKCLRGRRRCIVKNCANHTDQLLFEGDLCHPCYLFLVTNEGGDSQVFRNGLRLFVADYAKLVARLLDPTCPEPGDKDQAFRRLKFLLHG